MKKPVIACLGFFFTALFLWAIWAVANIKKHDFKDKCFFCHVNIPGKEDEKKDLVFTGKIDSLCNSCHALNQDKSHPIKVRPGKNIPLASHLDNDGLLTCTTCHDVHKEDKAQNAQELSGLLWGHVKGREFCALCHNQESLGATWKHQTAIPFAHSYGKLLQQPEGRMLDKYSVECLSCHDGTVSRFPQVEVKQGVWRHSIGESHPIGMAYPRSINFTPPESLAQEIKLFDGKVGCLSCHEIYGREKNMLVRSNNKSRLCLACHKK